MNKITTDFEKFINKKIEKQQKTAEFEPLSSDILFFKDENEEWEKSNEPVELVQVTGVLGDDEIDKLEEKLGIDLKTQMIGDIKRGEIIYLTALLKRKGSQSYTTQTTTGILKCRIVDIYQGLNRLKEIIDKQMKKK
jgi:hypothetical protein